MKLNWNLCGAIVLASLIAPLSAQEKTPEKSKNVVIATSDAVGNATKDGLSKTGEVMTDAWVTSRVHARFVSEELLKDSNISVDTAKHVVTLKGTVTTKAGRTKATSVALGTEGVRRVSNKLTIGPKHKN